jgi:hypothetical protein
MSKVINITDKLSNEKPSIQIGDKIYQINDSVETVLKFEELMSIGTSEALVEAISTSLGKESLKEISLKKMSIDNFKVLTIAITASVQGIEYEEAAARFQK